jgi:sarcosine oxidase gamma subunit
MINKRSAAEFSPGTMLPGRHCQTRANQNALILVQYRIFCEKIFHLSVCNGFADCLPSKARRCCLQLPE